VTVDRDKVRSKLQFIRDAVRQLEEIRARGEDALLTEPILEAAATRNLQVAIEAVLDIANHVIAREGLGLPTSYRNALEILLRKRILPAERSEDLLQMVSFRNRAVHLYDEIDPEEAHPGAPSGRFRCLRGRHLQGLLDGPSTGWNSI
jgi:uncharacterized protein YutE (UPF0331/DUF86 family)